MTFQAKSMQVEHTCGRTFNHGLASSTFLVERYQKGLSFIPDMKVSNLKDQVKTDINVNISKWQDIGQRKRQRN